MSCICIIYGPEAFEWPFLGFAVLIESSGKAKFEILVIPLVAGPV